MKKITCKDKGLRITCIGVNPNWEVEIKLTDVVLYKDLMNTTELLNTLAEFKNAGYDFDYKLV